MRILLIGDTPLMRRVERLYVEHFDGVRVAVALEPSLEAFDLFNPDVVVNGRTTEAGEGGTKAFSMNSKGSAVSALYAHMVGAEFFQISDSSVFNTLSPNTFQNPYPTSVYGLSKRLGERAIVDLHPKATIVRTGYLYGPEMPETPPAQAWEALQGDRKQPYLYVDLMVSPVYVGDAAAVLATNILTYQVLRRQGGVYHLAPQGVTTWVDYLKPQFPEVHSMESKFSMRHDYGWSMTVEPSREWTVNDGGLSRFLGEAGGGRWDWFGVWR